MTSLLDPRHCAARPGGLDGEKPVPDDDPDGFDDPDEIMAKLKAANAQAC